ncbi:MAG TPA: ATP-binding protein [Actinopolymorphaceae bacterium]
MSSGRRTLPDWLRPSDVATTLAALGWTWALVILVASWRPEREAFAWHIPWAEILVQSAIAATLIVRRRSPVLVLALTCTSVLVMLGVVLVGPDPGMATSPEMILIAPAATPFVTYAAAAFAGQRWVTWALVVLTTIVVARPWTPGVGVTSAAAVFVAAPALLGLYVAARRRLIVALRERAVRAEREQRLLADRARAEERRRLATEMHDVVTLRVDRMLELAARLRAEAPIPATREAADSLTSAGRQALAELDELVGLLRTGRDDEVPTTRLTGEVSPASLSDLIAESAAIGVTATLREEGTAEMLSPTVARTVYRIVQEGLTNVRKHAYGAGVDIRVRHDHANVRVTVRNGAPPVSSERDLVADLPASGSGSGLLGLRHRVELVDGRLRAGPTPDGGFELDAILPTYVPTSHTRDAPTPDAENR